MNFYNKNVLFVFDFFIHIDISVILINYNVTMRPKMMLRLRFAKYGLASKQFDFCSKAVGDILSLLVSEICTFYISSIANIILLPL